MHFDERTTMDATRERLARFFTDYAKATARGDVDEVAAAYSSTYLESTPTSLVAWQVDDEYRSGLRDQAESMRGLGLSEAQTAVEAISELAPGHVSVRVAWTLTFDRPHAPITSSFEITYVVRMVDDPQIVLYVPHEDETAVMRRDGVLPS